MYAYLEKKTLLRVWWEQLFLPNLCQVFYIINDKKARVQMPLHVTFPEGHMVTVEKGVWPSCWGAVDKMHLHELHFSVGFVYNIYR